MASLKKDIKKSADWLITAFKEIDKKLDYSVKSVEHIETVLSEQFEEGQPKANGLFAKGLGAKLFAISSYIGEVIIKNTKATKWITDDHDPQGEINIKLLSANGTSMFPAHRVMKRIQNGEEDNVYHYTVIAVKKYMDFDGEIPIDFKENEITEDGKSLWKFW